MYLFLRYVENHTSQQIVRTDHCQKHFLFTKNLKFRENKPLQSFLLSFITNAHQIRQRLYSINIFEKLYVWDVEREIRMLRLSLSR